MSFFIFLQINSHDCTKVDLEQANKYLNKEILSNSSHIKLVVSTRPKNSLLCSYKDEKEKTSSSSSPILDQNSTSSLSSSSSQFITDSSVNQSCKAATAL